MFIYICDAKNPLDVTLIDIPHFIKVTSLVTVFYILFGYQMQFAIYSLLVLASYELFRLIRARAYLVSCLAFGLSLCYLVAAVTLRLALM